MVLPIPGSSFRTATSQGLKKRKRPEKGLNVQEYNEREKGETRVSGRKILKTFYQFFVPVKIRSILFNFFSIS